MTWSWLTILALLAGPAGASAAAARAADSPAASAGSGPSRGAPAARGHRHSAPWSASAFDDSTPRSWTRPWFDPPRAVGWVADGLARPGTVPRSARPGRLGPSGPPAPPPFPPPLFESSASRRPLPTARPDRPRGRPGRVPSRPIARDPEPPALHPSGNATHDPIDHRVELAQSPARPRRRARADRGGHPLGPRAERRGVSRPDAAAGRGHHAEPGVQPRGDGAPDRHPDRDRPQRDARPGGPPEHLGRRPERHQMPVRLRDRLLVGPPGGDQPDRLRRQPARRGHAGPLPLEPDRRDRPLRPGRARATRPTSSRRSRIGSSSGP